MYIRIPVLIFAFAFVTITYACPEPCQCNTTTNTIDCSSRNLVNLPDFSNISISKIQLLDFSRNNLTILNSTEFGDLFSFFIEKIDFSFNQVYQVIGEFSDGNNTIGYRTLNLSNNLLTTFPINIVRKKQLRSELVIDISHNALLDLPANIFREADGFYQEFQLLARNNEIKYIHPDVFDGPVIMEAVIDLRNNNLENIPQELKLPEGIRTIKMADNPWRCDCRLRWILESRYRNFSMLSPPSCAAPDGFKGRPLFQLTKDEFACAPESNENVTALIDKGQYHLLLCPVTSDPPNPQVTWKIIQSDGTNEPFSIEVQSPSLKLTNLKSNELQYQCTATNPAGSVTVDIQLDVTTYEKSSDDTETEMTDFVTDASVTVVTSYNKSIGTTPSNGYEDLTFITEILEEFTNKGSSVLTDEYVNLYSTMNSDRLSSNICISYSSFVVFLVCLAVAVFAIIVILFCSIIFCCRIVSDQKQRQLDFEKRRAKSRYTFEGPGMYADDAEEATPGNFHFTESSTAL